MSFMEPAEFKRGEIDVPDAIVDFFQAHILSGADSGDIDPVRVPADAAIRTDIPDLEAIGIVEWWKLRRHGTGRRCIDGSRRLLIEGLVRTLVVVFRAEAVEPALLGSKTARCRSGCLGLESFVHAFMATVLLGLPGLNEFWQYAKADPPGRE